MLKKLLNLLKNNPAKQILGLNRRNQNYLRPLNSAISKKIADDKLLCKRILRHAGIQTPELYRVIRTPKQLEFVDWENLPISFVIKPNQGSRGRGILIFYGKKKNELAWIRPNGDIATIADIKAHIMKIFEGQFSLGNKRDIALIEERLKIDNTLKHYSYKGVPDIRIIVFNSIPVMAMARIPTKESDGKANLHAGAICVGIDIASGVTTNAIHRKAKAILDDTYENIETTLDLNPNLPLKGIKIPYWNEILEIAVKCQLRSKLGYAGVDIAIDRNKGPMVFELNARPGLGIQIANQAGLRFRLERVEGLKFKSVKHSVQIAKNLFGGEITDEIELLSGKHIANLVEKIRLYEKPRTKIRKNKSHLKRGDFAVRGLLDTGITTSRIDYGTAAKLGYTDALEAFKSLKVPDSFRTFEKAQAFIDKKEKRRKAIDGGIVRLAKTVEEGRISVRPVLKIQIDLKGEQKEIEVIVSSRKELLYPILIGRRELKGFLIDTSKTFAR